MIKIINCRLEDNGVGIKAPMSADIEITGTSFDNNRVAMDLYYSPEYLSRLGLPLDTPSEYLNRAIDTMRSMEGLPNEAKRKALHDSDLFKWLGHSASLASIASTLIQLVSNR